MTENCICLFQLPPVNCGAKTPQPGRTGIRRFATRLPRSQTLNPRPAAARAGGCGFTVRAGAGYIRFVSAVLPYPNPPSQPGRRLVHRVTAPHGVREDPYYWLRDDTRSDPQVLAHLRAETAYAEAVLAPRSR